MQYQRGKSSLPMECHSTSRRPCSQMAQMRAAYFDAGDGRLDATPVRVGLVCSNAASPAFWSFRVVDAIKVACPVCASQPDVECDWGAVSDHPRFHAGRFEVAAFVARVNQGLSADAPVDPAIEKEAIDAAASDLI